jgi:hypothetical protein
LWTVIQDAPRKKEVCAMCGVDRMDVKLLVEGSVGFVCSACAPTIVYACAEQDSRGRGPYLAEALVQSLAALDPKTRWAEVEPLLDAAMLLASGDTVLADRLAWEAFRFQHYARARAALDLVSPAARTAWNRLHRVFVCLVLEDRAGIAVELATLDAISLSPAERHLADVHRAWAAFRLETRGEPTFTMDRERVAEVVGEVRPTGPPMLLARALEVLASLERTRDHAASLAHLDEASALVELPSIFLLRGDIAAERDLAAARAAWERARTIANPDSVWAERAASRLARSK